MINTDDDCQVRKRSPVSWPSRPLQSCDHLAETKISVVWVARMTQTDERSSGSQRKCQWDTRRHIGNREDIHRHTDTPFMGTSGGAAQPGNG